MNPKIIGLTRIRNESHIIRETLDHMSEFCSGGIFVYDDCSEDNTYEICKNHSAVKEIIKGAYWDENRERAEFENRQVLLETAKVYADPDDWFIYMDADERIDFDWNKIARYDKDVAAIRMKLFDFYITGEDVDKKYNERMWLGPEFREIIMAFKNADSLIYEHPDQREVSLGRRSKIINDGFVKHYGKAISVDEWEKTCDYYANHFPKYSEKWKKRKGKAIHNGTSDFGNDLIVWCEKELKGVPLLPTIEKGDSLKILIGTHHLIDLTGSEIYTFTLAEQLVKAGHDVKVYSKYIDKMRDQFEAINVELFDDIEKLREFEFDVAHVHHNITAFEVRSAFPELPIIMLSQGVLPFLEQPPNMELGISKFLGISLEVINNLLKKNVPSNRISYFPNIVDESKFTSGEPINEKPRKALIISGRLDKIREKIIRRACEMLSIETRFVGGRFGSFSQQKVLSLIKESDIVFSLGRGAIEAMMCGRVPVIFDYLGGDGMVTPEAFDEIRKNNFSGRRYKKNFSAEELAEEINKYQQNYGTELRELAVQNFSASKYVKHLIEIYKTAIEKGPIPLSEENQRSIEFIMNIMKETKSYSHEIAVRNTTHHLTQQFRIRENVLKAEIMINGGEYERAIMTLNEALAEDPNNIDALNNISVAYILNSDLPDATNIINRILELNPDDEIANSNLAYLRTRYESLKAS
jgi:tetratricopeptide (TPR) repeat protein